MINFFKKPNEKIFGLKSLDLDTLIYRVLPRWLAEIMKKYFRLEIEGLENIPKKGPAIVAPNHSGYSGFDAVVLAMILQKEARRIPRVMTHHFWFLTETTSVPAQKLGFTEATFENGIQALKKKNLIVLFPEGEQGNFKPTRKKYQLQEFKRGFVRMALQTGSPIIPTLVIGAEETHITLNQLKLTRFLKGVVIPMPLNILPLPARWKIVFLPPIHLPHPPEAADDNELVYEICFEIQEKMQAALVKELKKRKSIYL